MLSLQVDSAFVESLKGKLITIRYKSNLQMDSLLSLISSVKTKQDSAHVHNTSHRLYLLRLSYMQGLYLLEYKIGN